jgi:hypothetical protein
MKALLEELGQPIPYIRDCEQLRNLVLLHYASFRLSRRGMAFLSNYAVAARYPGRNASKR